MSYFLRKARLQFELIRSVFWRLSIEDAKLTVSAYILYRKARLSSAYSAKQSQKLYLKTKE